MARAAQATGKRAASPRTPKDPSVSAIIGRFKESGGLIQWAWRQGLDGKNLHDRGAITVGRLVEQMIQDELLGTSTPLPESSSPREVQLALNCMPAFRSWRDRHQLRVLVTQVSLRSAAHRFTGRPDAVVVLDDVVTIVDWKATGGIYLDQLLQIAAYKLLVEEQTEWSQVGGGALIRIDKDTGEIDPHTWDAGVLKEAAEMFLVLRRAFDFDRKLKAVI